MEEGLRTITAEEFASMFGDPAPPLSEGVRDMIGQNDFSYAVLEGPDRDRVILGALRRLEAPLKVSGEHRKDDWETGWAENLAAFRAAGEASGLTPKYFDPAQVLRIHRRYARPLLEGFIERFHAVYRRILFELFLGDADTVWEFGCGTGHNLVALAGIFPGKRLVGLDWAASAVSLVNSLGSGNISGRAFDMFAPDESVAFGGNDAVLTIHALEQLGCNHGRFLDFLLRRRPAICVHVEPVLELYDEDNLLDYLAIRYHRRRGYLDGFLARLRELESGGKVELLRVRRGFFGSTFDEGYSLVIWRPI